MIKASDKVSVRQVIFLLLTMVFTISIRILPQVTASSAKQAAWVTPLTALPFLLLLIYIMSVFFRKKENTNLSFTNIIYKIVGGVFGRIIVFLYLVWIVILSALYVRYYGERLVSSIAPNTPNMFFIIFMLITVFVFLKKGIVLIARMNEVILYIIAITFLVLFIMSMPIINVKNLLPVSHLDALPILWGSYGILPAWTYLFYLFFFGDRISDKENLWKYGLRGSIFLTAVTVMLFIMTIGDLSHSVASRVPLPFFVAVRQISLFEFVERLEAVTVALWVFADFILISVFSYTALSIIKSLFNLKSVKHLSAPFLAFIFVLSMNIANTNFQLERFSKEIVMHANNIFQIGVPILLLIVGKLRKKV